MFQTALTFRTGDCGAIIPFFFSFLHFLFCQVELFSDKSNTHEFVNLVKELALPGELTQNRSYDFEFMQVEKPYESYVGANVRLRSVLFVNYDSNMFW